jgi:hypothetical protein
MLAPDRQQEIDALHARIAALERELTEQTARANAAVAAAQERTYWLDRWHLDLDALMARPWVRRLDAGARRALAIARWFARSSQRLRARILRR